MVYFEKYRVAPMPADLEGAQKEIQTLRNILFAERLKYVKKVEQRELEKHMFRKLLKEKDALIEALEKEIGSVPKTKPLPPPLPTYVFNPNTRRRFGRVNEYRGGGRRLVVRGKKVL